MKRAHGVAHIIPQKNGKNKFIILPVDNQTGLEPMSLSTVNFRAFLRDSV